MGNAMTPEQELASLRAQLVASQQREKVLREDHDKMYALLETFGRTVTDMFEQMERGNWTDDHGHDVRINKAMLSLKQPVIDTITLRAEQALNAGKEREK